MGERLKPQITTGFCMDGLSDKFILSIRFYADKS